MPYLNIYVKLLNNVLTSYMNMTLTDNSKQADIFEWWLRCLFLNTGWDVTVGRGCELDAFTHFAGRCQLFDVQRDELWVFAIEWQGVIHAYCC